MSAAFEQFLAGDDAVSRLLHDALPAYEPTPALEARFQAGLAECLAARAAVEEGLFSPAADAESQFAQWAAAAQNAQAGRRQAVLRDMATHAEASTTLGAPVSPMTESWLRHAATIEPAADVHTPQPRSTARWGWWGLALLSMASALLVVRWSGIQPFASHIPSPEMAAASAATAPVAASFAAASAAEPMMASAPDSMVVAALPPKMVEPRAPEEAVSNRARTPVARARVAPEVETAASTAAPPASPVLADEGAEVELPAAKMQASERVLAAAPAKPRVQAVVPVASWTLSLQQAPAEAVAAILAHRPIGGRLILRIRDPQGAAAWLEDLKARLASQAISLQIETDGTVPAGMAQAHWES